MIDSTNIKVNQSDAVESQPIYQADKNKALEQKETLKLEKELQETMTNLEKRINGQEKKLKDSKQSLIDYKSSWNYFRDLGSEKEVLQKQLEIEIKHKAALEKQQEKLKETALKVKDLISKGDYAQAKALMEGKEQEYKQQMSQASKQAIQGSQSVNKKLKDSDQFLGKVETGMRVTRNTLVVVGATVATGGAAGAMAAAGYGTAAAAGAAIATGTTAGTTIGALSNTAEATGHIALGNKTLEQAKNDAIDQTLQDAKSSAIASVGTIAGGGAGKLVGKVGEKIVGKVGEKAANYIAAATTGATAGTTNAAISTGINMAELRIKAEQEFTQLYGNQLKDMDQKDINKLKQGFLEKKGLTSEQMIKSAAFDVAVGMISGGQGGASGALKEATKGSLKQAGITALEGVGSIGIGLGASYIKEGGLTFEAVAQEISGAIVGDVVGEMAAKNNSAPRTLRESLVAESGVFGKLFTKSKPPESKTPQTTTTTKPAETSEPKTTQATTTTKPEVPSPTTAAIETSEPKTTQVPTTNTPAETPEPKTTQATTTTKPEVSPPTTETSQAESDRTKTNKARIQNLLSDGNSTKNVTSHADPLNLEHQLQRLLNDPTYASDPKIIKEIKKIVNFISTVSDDRSDLILNKFSSVLGTTHGLSQLINLKVPPVLMKGCVKSLYRELRHASSFIKNREGAHIIPDTNIRVLNDSKVGEIPPTELANLEGALKIIQKVSPEEFQALNDLIVAISFTPDGDDVNSIAHVSKSDPSCITVTQGESTPLTSKEDLAGILLHELDHVDLGVKGPSIEEFVKDSGNRYIFPEFEKSINSNVLKKGDHTPHIYYTEARARVRQCKFYREVINKCNDDSIDVKKLISIHNYEWENAYNLVLSLKNLLGEGVLTEKGESLVRNLEKKAGLGYIR